MVYSIESLRREYQKGNYYKFLFFWGHTPPAHGTINQSCLSQWWMQNFEIDGICYSCAEQYMMVRHSIKPLRRLQEILLKAAKKY